MSLGESEAWLPFWNLYRHKAFYGFPWLQFHELEERNRFAFLVDVLLQGHRNRLLGWVDYHFLALALDFHVDDELGADSDLASDAHCSAHFLDDLFADGQTEAGSRAVAALLVFELAEVHEEIGEVVLADSNAGVSDGNLEMDVLPVVFRVRLLTMDEGNDLVFGAPLRLVDRLMRK